METPRNQRARQLAFGLGAVALVALLAFAWVWNNDRNISIKDALIANISESSATIVWTSETAYAGQIVYAEVKDNQTPFNLQFGQQLASDDRGGAERFTHHVTLKNLQPATTYYFKIAGAAFGKEALVRSFSTTEARGTISAPIPAYGEITGETNSDAIIVLHKRDFDEGNPQFVSSPIAANNSYSVDITPLGKELTARQLSAVLKLGNNPSIEHEYQAQGLMPFEDIEVKQTTAVLGLGGEANLLKKISAQTLNSRCSDGLRTIGAVVEAPNGNVNLRETGDLQANVLGKIDRGNTATVLEISEATPAWVKVRNGAGQEGWANCSVIKLRSLPDGNPPTVNPPAVNPPSSNPEPAGGNSELPQNCQISARATVSLKVRSGPGTNFGQIGGLGAGQTISLCQQETGESIQGNNIWYSLVQDGKKGYVTATYLAIGGDAPSSQSPTVTTTQSGEPQQQSTLTPQQTNIPEVKASFTPALPAPTAPEASPNIAYLPVAANVTAPAISDEEAEQKLQQIWEQIKIETNLRERLGGDVSLKNKKTSTGSYCFAGGSLECRLPALKTYLKQSGDPIRSADYPRCLLYHEAMHYTFARCPVPFNRKLSEYKELAAEASASAYCANLDRAYGKGDYYFFLEGQRGKYRALDAAAIVNNYLKSQGYSRFTIQQLYTCDTAVVDYYAQPGTEAELAKLKSLIGNYAITMRIEMTDYEPVGSNVAQAPELGPGVNVLGAATAESTAKSLEVDSSGIYSVFVDGNLASTEQLALRDGQKSLTVQVFQDVNNNRTYDAGEKLVSTDNIELKQESEGASYELDAGWNLIHIPLTAEDNSAIFSASRLMEAWNSEGGKITQLAKFADGKFQIMSEGERGLDFDVKVGEGLFVFNAGAQRQLNIYGYRPTSNPPQILNQGWNLVGYASTPAATATELISKLGAKSLTVDTVSQFKSGQYQSLIAKDGTSYGNDFNINSQSGYFVRVEQGGGKAVEL